MDSVDTSRKKRNGRKQGVLFKLFKHGGERRGGWGRQLADNLRPDCFTRVKCKQWITSEIFARKHTEHSTRRVARNLLVTVHYMPTRLTSDRQKQEFAKQLFDSSRWRILSGQKTECQTPQDQCERLKTKTWRNRFLIKRELKEPKKI